MDVKILYCVLFSVTVIQNIEVLGNSTGIRKMYGKWDNETTKLRRDLLTNYDKYNPPIDDKFGNTTIVWVFLALRFVNDFDEVSGHLESTVMIQAWWQDTRLTWNPSDYNGYKDGLALDFKTIWVPHVILWNPVEQFVILDPQNDHLLAKAYPFMDSNVYFLIGGKIVTHCVPNVRYFPFDKHECFIELIVYESLYFHNTIRLNLTEFPLPFELSDNPQWIIRKGKPEVKNFLNVGIFVASFPFTLQRRPVFLLFNLIAPILLLSLINVCVFAIPIDSGERNSFAITVFLALAVYMTVVADSIPHSSNPMPLWSYFLLFKLIYSSCIALFSTIVMRLSNKSTQVPRWLILLSVFWDKLFACFKNRSKETINQGKNVSIEKTQNRNNDSIELDGNATLRENETGSGNKTWKHAAYILDKLLLILFLFIALLEILFTFIFTIKRVV